MKLRSFLIGAALLIVPHLSEAGRFNPATGVIASMRHEWFDATRTAQQDCAGSVDGHCKVTLSDGTVIAAPADTPAVTAGGGVIAWENSIDSAVHDSLGRMWPAAGLATSGASPDGAYALKVLRNSFGPWDVIEKDGSRWRLTDGDAHDVQLLGQRRAIWMIGNQRFATPGLTVVFPKEAGWGGRAAWVIDHYGVLYQRQSDGALVFDRHVIEPPSDKYFYADVEVRNNVVRVTWSPSQSDDNPQLLEMPVATLSTLPLSDATPPPIPVPTPVPTPTPPPVVAQPPNAFATFQAAVNAHPDLLAQLRALADQGDANGWQDATQQQHAALRARLLRYGAYAVYQQDANWGLLKKDGGSLGTRADGVKHATDILVYRPTMALVDVFDDRTPSWGPLDMSLDFNHRDASFWIQPVPEGGVTPPPVPVPPPPVVEDPRIAELQKQLDAVTARVSALESERDDLKAQRDQLTRERDDARTALAVALNKPQPSCEAKVPSNVAPLLKRLGIKVGCRIIQ